MCGIVGAVGTKRAVSVVVNGLKKLEYRGYDSAGVATGGVKIAKCRAVGKVAALEAAMQAEHFATEALLALGHTRWATHGKPKLENAHPQQVGSCAVVHNGIIENAEDLRTGLLAGGVVFTSETDTEVVPALVQAALNQKKKPQEAVRESVAQLKGAFALGLMVAGEENLWGAKNGAPLVVGLAAEALFLASDPMALPRQTTHVVFLEDGDVAQLSATELQVWDREGKPALRPQKPMVHQAEDFGKQGFRHFMLKEIYEQPSVVRQILAQNTFPEGLDLTSISGLTFVACGSAFYACHLAKPWLETFAQIPVDVEMASEFRYRQPFLQKGRLVVALSQSGETTDTLAALAYAKAQGAKTFAFVNVPHSTMAREVDLIAPLQAGVEVSVASTKAFTAMGLALLLFALKFGAGRKALGAEPKQVEQAEKAAQLEADLQKLPTYMEQVLLLEKEAEAIANKLFVESKGVFYLGRGTSFSMALEGALKMKEITYTHAEAYPAGEMKHGPIALVDSTLPVVLLAGAEPILQEKNAASLQEVKARNARVLMVGNAAAVAKMGKEADFVLETPTVCPELEPFLQVIVLQFLAYYAALARGLDIDQPRNLAKSVTVE